MEIDNLLKQALTFTEPYSNYDPKTQVPTTGDDFLRYVIHEKSKYSDVMTVELNDDKRNTTVNYNIHDVQGCVKAPEELVPSLQWQHTQLEEFDRMRKRIDRLKHKNIKRNCPQLGPEEWQTFCLENEPILSIILAVSQPDLANLIELLAEWLDETENGNAIERYMAVWIYATLSCLAIPLLPETCFALRQIARKCSQLRAALPPAIRGDEYVRPLNLIICLVSRYFYQIDLADG